MLETYSETSMFKPVASSGRALQTGYIDSLNLMRSSHEALGRVEALMSELASFKQSLDLPSTYGHVGSKTLSGSVRPVLFGESDVYYVMSISRLSNSIVRPSVNLS